MSTDAEPTELLDSLVSLTYLHGHRDTDNAFDEKPYYDNDLDVHPHLRRKVEAELAKHSKQPTGILHPKVPPPINLFENHPLLAAELKRVETHQPIPPLDTVRYQLPAPGENEQEEAWRKAVQNAKTQLEHQRIRQTNLSLLQAYGPNAWKIHNYIMEASTTRLEKTLEQLKEKTVEVNRERKNGQTLAGAQLTTLETKWTELISNVLQIELANIVLEVELAQLKNRERELDAIEL
ncbi:hypothetical protein Clacol_003810 [Clathrus columnatus]|uniref:Pre-mRNA-splicing factor SPF27 n=1 Tax=Clathrus columnatus TaxID=1419009 RepID=A0AAV5A4R9_9AGAM|nr:hypothetical protein Clacol_003810 [Clathrus columnatus]